MNPNSNEFQIDRTRKLVYCLNKYNLKLKELVIEYESRKIDFRVSTMPSYYGEKVVLRILDTYKGVRSVDDLNMNPQQLSLHAL